MENRALQHDNKLLLFFLTRICLEGEVGGCVPTYTWRSEDNLQDSILSFYHVNPGNYSQASGFGSKCPYLLSHLTCQDNIPVLSSQSTGNAEKKDIREKRTSVVPAFHRRYLWRESAHILNLCDPS